MASKGPGSTAEESPWRCESLVVVSPTYKSHIKAFPGKPGGSALDVLTFVGENIGLWQVL